LKGKLGKEKIKREYINELPQLLERLARRLKGFINGREDTIEE